MNAGVIVTAKTKGKATRVNVYIPVDLHKLVAKSAAKNRYSMSHQICAILYENFESKSDVKEN